MTSFYTEYDLESATSKGWYGTNKYQIFATWAPDRESNPLVGSPMPLIIYLHGGGNTSNYGATEDGDGFSSVSLSVGKAVTKKLGIPLMSIEFPPGAFGKQENQFHPYAFFPHAEIVIAKAVQWAKDNANVTGYWGNNVTIDPDKIGFLGESEGGMHATRIGMKPIGWFPYHPTMQHGARRDTFIGHTKGDYSYKNDHRVSFIINHNGAISLGAVHHNNGAQTGIAGHYNHLYRPRTLAQGDESVDWDNFDMEIKLAASPILGIMAEYPENKEDLSYLGYFDGSSSLLPSDWKLDQPVAGWTNPHDEFQGQPLHNALSGANLQTYEVYWGDNSAAHVNARSGEYSYSRVGNSFTGSVVDFLSQRVFPTLSWGL
jgi:hypothetical protein